MEERLDELESLWTRDRERKKKSDNLRPRLHWDRLNPLREQSICYRNVPLSSTKQPHLIPWIILPVTGPSQIDNMFFADLHRQFPPSTLLVSFKRVGQSSGPINRDLAGPPEVSSRLALQVWTRQRYQPNFPFIYTFGG